MKKNEPKNYDHLILDEKCELMLADSEYWEADKMADFLLSIEAPNPEN